MLVLVTNQKGGCGKTTIAMQFANYLAKKEVPLIVLDCDFQRTFMNRREDDIKNFPENELPYEVQETKIEEIVPIANSIGDEGVVIVDCPGRIDNSMDEALKAADFIIIPFAYDINDVNSTIIYSIICQDLQLKGKIIFVPNRYNRSIRYETQDDVMAAFSMFGVISPEIAERAAMKRANSLILTSEVEVIVADAFEFVQKLMQG